MLSKEQILDYSSQWWGSEDVVHQAILAIELQSQIDGLHWFKKARELQAKLDAVREYCETFRHSSTRYTSDGISDIQRHILAILDGDT